MNEILFTGGYWALLLTVAAYQLGAYLRKKTGSAWCNPILVAVAIVIPVLLVAGVPNEDYQAGMQSISWLLTPCTVCLGIPLYTQVNRLKGNLGAIIGGIVAGSVTSLIVVGGLSLVFSLDRETMVSLLPKSITTAMAIPLSESGGGIVALTTAVVILTGILGSVIGPMLCRLFGIRGEIPQGVAFGTASHVIGTTKAVETSELTGAVSSLSLVVAGIVTAVIFPFLI